MALKRDIAWNLVGSVLPLVIGALSVPYMLRALGVERFGILTMLWSVVGYASLFDFGLGRATTQQIASRLTIGQTELVDSIARSAVLLTAVIGIVIGGLMALCAGELAERTLNVSPAIAAEVRKSVIIVSAGVPLATVSNGLRGVAEAYREFAKVNLAKIVTGIAIFLLPMGALVFCGSGLVGVAAALVLARGIGVGFFWIIRRSLPRHAGASRSLTFADQRRIFSTGLWMSVSSVISPVLVNADRFVISNLLGAAQVAYYTTPFEFLVRMLILPSAIGSSLLPRMTAVDAASERATRRLFRRALAATALMMLAMCALCALLARPLLVIAASADFARRSLPVVYILLIGIFANGIANIPYTALHSRGSARYTGVAHMIELVCYLPMLFILVRYCGLIGAAIAWSCRSVADCVVMFAGYRLPRRP